MEKKEKMELITRHLCKASDLGVHGNLFGGKMLSWLDEAGAIMATRICKTKKLVTVSMNGIEFHTPVKENHDVTIYGEVTGMGTSSITLKLNAKRFDVYSEKELEVCNVTVVFVRIDGEGKSRSIDLEVRNKYKHLSKKDEKKN
jgi:acyl-CoA thioesterase YciA